MQGLRELHRFLSVLGRKPNHGEKPPCCRKKKKKSLCWMKGLLQPPLQGDHQGTSTLTALFLEMLHSSPLSSPGKSSLYLALPLLICFHRRKREKRQFGETSGRCTEMLPKWSRHHLAAVRRGGGSEVAALSRHSMLRSGSARNRADLNTLGCSGCCLSSQPA